MSRSSDCAVSLSNVSMPLLPARNAFLCFFACFPLPRAPQARQTGRQAPAAGASTIGPARRAGQAYYSAREIIRRISCQGDQPELGGQHHKRPRQKWQAPCLLSHLEHNGVCWLGAHCSSGMRSLAKQAAPLMPSQKLPVRRPQSTQERQSMSTSPYEITSKVTESSALAATFGPSPRWEALSF